MCLFYSHLVEFQHIIWHLTGYYMNVRVTIWIITFRTNVKHHFTQIQKTISAICALNTNFYASTNESLCFRRRIVRGPIRKSQQSWCHHCWVVSSFFLTLVWSLMTVTFTFLHKNVLERNVFDGDTETEMS